MGTFHDIFLNEDRSKIWLATSTGIWVADRSDPEHPQWQHHLKKQNTSTILRDREGNFWVATLDQGVFMLPQLGQIERLMDVEENLRQPVVLLQPARDAEHVWIGLADGILLYYHATQQTIVGAYKDEASKVAPFNIFEWPSKGQVWALYGGRIVLLDFPTLRPLSPPEPIVVVRKYLPHVNDTVLVFSGNFGYILQNEKPIAERVIAGERPADLIFDQERGKAFWVSCSSNLYYYTFVSHPPQAIVDPQNQKPIIGRSMVLMDDGTLWVGTITGTLYAIEDRTKVVGHYQPPEHEEGPMACRALATDGQRIWMGTDRGLLCYDPMQQQWRRYNKLDGLSSNQIRALVFVAPYLYIATPKGLMRMRPDFDPHNATPPSIRLKRLQIGQRDTVPLLAYELQHHQNNLTVTLEGIALRSQGRMTYRYRLLPSDSTWKERPYNSSAIEYTALPPGEYLFEAIAVNEDGVASTEPVQIALSLARPYWQQWWFRGILVLGLAGLISLGVWWRLRLIRQRELAMAQTKERLQTLRLSALQAQMNPHFVFNALSAIEFFITNGQLQKALHYHGKLARLMRQTFEFTKKKRVTLEAELGFLELYLDLEKMRLDNKIDIVFDIPAALEAELDDILLPPLLLQPIIENSFKHGLLHRQTPGHRLSIAFALHELGEGSEYLAAVIQDNGVGVARAKELSAWRLKEGHRSSGWATVRERLHLLADEAAPPEVLVCTDLSAQGGEGTRVTLWIRTTSKYHHTD